MITIMIMIMIMIIMIIIVVVVLFESGTIYNKVPRRISALLESILKAAKLFSLAYYLNFKALNVSSGTFVSFLSLFTVIFSFCLTMCLLAL